MSDQTVIVKGTGSIFLAGPPLVKAATGEEVSVEDLGGGLVHTQVSGVSDHLAENDTHALGLLRQISLLRQIVKHLGPAKPAQLSLQAPKTPLYDPNEILGILPTELSRSFDVREVIARLVDASEFLSLRQTMDLL